MSSDVLSLLTSCLTASQQPERSRRGRLADDAVGGPLWSIKVSVSPSLIERIIDYAIHQELTIGGVTGRLESVTATDDGITVKVSGDAWDRASKGEATVGYAKGEQGDMERTLCTGKWLQLKYGRVRVTRLLPTVVPKPYGADIRIGAEFQRPGFFSWLVNSHLSHFELHRTKVVPVLTSKFKTFVAPDIQFVWKGAT